MEKEMLVVYYLKVNHMKYITTDITVMTEFCIFMDVLGDADTRGHSSVEIPLTRINAKFEDILFPVAI